MTVKSPWYHVAIDFIGPITPTSDKGNCYILTLRDYFTKYTEAIPLPTKCATEVASVLFKVQLCLTALMYTEIILLCFTHHFFRSLCVWEFLVS